MARTDSNALSIATNCRHAGRKRSAALGFVELDDELVALHWHAAFPLANRDQSSNVRLTKLARSARSEA